LFNSTILFLFTKLSFHEIAASPTWRERKERGLKRRREREAASPRHRGRKGRGGKRKGEVGREEREAGQQNTYQSTVLGVVKVFF
jgi:hypothetical protein